MNGSKPSTSKICPLCQGYQIVEVDDPARPGQVKTVPCRCQTPKRWQPAPGYAHMTFAGFKPRRDAPNLQKAVQTALDFVHNDKTILTISGPNGNGKTHLALAIAHEMAQEGKTPVVWLVISLLEAMRPNSSAGDVFTPCVQADLLVLDDLGAEKSSDWVDEKLFEIIHRRYLAGLKTAITTNLHPEHGFSPRIADRLLDVHCCQVLVLTASSYRRLKLGT